MRILTFYHRHMNVMNSSPMEDEVVVDRIKNISDKVFYSNYLTMSVRFTTSLYVSMASASFLSDINFIFFNQVEEIDCKALLHISKAALTDV